ncbi:MAG: hypothetical protein LBR55_02850 [Bacteroidales bacterium]|jgi:16S rRNA C967 or C1407 C5-methylase (RsmB/RsmF family)/NOL1/NOP2/fmu family ribosome biogenesis protein|nr:hypothetical protein [Bacteroidales bacterium]
MNLNLQLYFTNELHGITSGEELYNSLQTESPTSIRINPNKITKQLPLPHVAWCEQGYYLPQRPKFTLDPAFHAGAYYVQEASSMFLEQIVKPLATRPLKVFDVCAAPGGKSTQLISLMQRGSVLVANEVIQSRAQILSENLIKWGKSNCVVTNNDPKDFGFLEGFFDIVVVDAPCSGEGMFRKDPQAINEWSEANVDLCSKRQTRILHDIWNCVTPGGTLIYSTCTFNQKENEDVVANFLQQTGAKCRKISLQPEWNIVEHEKNGAVCYRFFPHKVQGEGFSISVIQKYDGKEFEPPRKQVQSRNITIIPHKNRLHYSNLIANYESVVYERKPGVIWSFSKDYRKFLLDVFAHCKVVHAGIPLVETIGHKLNPLPGLAFASSFNQTILPQYEIDLLIAIRYFKKEALVLENLPAKGWIHLIYNGISIGFVKNIGNRANNPYPAAWAIKMNIQPELLWSITELY